MMTPLVGVLLVFGLLVTATALFVGCLLIAAATVTRYIVEFLAKIRGGKQV